MAPAGKSASAKVSLRELRSSDWNHRYIWFRICILYNPTKCQWRPMYLKNRYHGYAFVRFLDLIEFDHICIFGRLKFCKLTPAFSIRHIYSQKLNLGRNCIKARKAESDLEFRKKWMWTRQWSVCRYVPNGYCPCCAHVVPMGKLFPVKMMIQDIECTCVDLKRQ